MLELRRMVALARTGVKSRTWRSRLSGCQQNSCSFLFWRWPTVLLVSVVFNMFVIHSEIHEDDAIANNGQSQLNDVWDMALAAETSFVVKLIQSHSVTKSFFEILQFPISSFQHAQQFARYVCDFKELLHSNLFLPVIASPSTNLCWWWTMFLHFRWLSQIRCNETDITSPIVIRTIA